MIKTVFIDIDDTLIDFPSSADFASRKAAEETGITLPENTKEVFVAHNTALWKKVEQGIYTLDDIRRTRWKTIFADLGIKYDGEAFEVLFRKHLAYSKTHVEGAEELLIYLSSKYPVYVASNGPVFQQKNRMECAGLTKYMKDYFISEGVGYSKPSARFFETALRESGADAASSIMIGDSLSADIAGANNAGIKSIWMSHGRKREACDPCPTYTVAKLDEIKNIL